MAQINSWTIISRRISLGNRYQIMILMLYRLRIQLRKSELPSTASNKSKEAISQSQGNSTLHKLEPNLGNIMQVSNFSSQHHRITSPKLKTH